MNDHKETKINQLLQKLPANTVATTQWLHTIGLGLGNVTSYVKSGWLDRIGVGAVARRGRAIEWTGAVNALQSQAGLSIHPGGKTALGLLGALHYVPLGIQPASLFCRTAENLPQWFLHHDWNAPLEIHRSNLFGDNDGLGISDITMGDFSLKVSSHERAIMEYLYLLDENNTGDEPVRLMEGLAWLRPNVVQQLLETCRSAKVKRLFLVLSEMAGHPWLGKLDLEKVDTGTGKRQFAKGGHLHKRYQITVPRAWQQKKEEPS